MFLWIKRIIGFCAGYYAFHYLTGKFIWAPSDFPDEQKLIIMSTVAGLIAAYPAGCLSLRRKTIKP